MVKLTRKHRNESTELDAPDAADGVLSAGNADAGLRPRTAPSSVELASGQPAAAGTAAAPVTAIPGESVVAAPGAARAGQQIGDVLVQRGLVTHD